MTIIKRDIQARNRQEDILFIGSLRERERIQTVEIRNTIEFAKTNTWYKADIKRQNTTALAQLPPFTMIAILFCKTAAAYTG